MNAERGILTQCHLPSRSPFVLSVRNFGRNRLAMAGFIVVSIITILVVLAPWISPHNPTELRPWLGVTAPGTEHPDCQAENTFTVNQPAESTSGIRNAKEVKLSVQTSDIKEFRVALKRGKVNKIIQVAGAVSLDKLDLEAGAQEVRELLEGGVIGRKLPKIKLHLGDEPPQDFMPSGQRVIFLQILDRAIDREYSVILKDSVVTSIREGNNAINSVTIKGESIRKVVADGRILTQKHILGTDELGRDLLSRILYGGRISLLIGVTATLVSLVIGVCYGSASAYFGGKVDRILMGIIDILYAIPFMFLVIILLVLFGRNIIILFVALGAVQWLTMARIIRGQILSLKEMEYIAAARICGAGPLRVLFRHLIPNAIGPMIIFATLTVPIVILEESFLSFIGLTVQFQGENLDSWGALVHQGMQALGTDGSKSWLLVWPSVAMALTLFGLNCIGDGLRDAFDPKTRKI